MQLRFQKSTHRQISQDLFLTRTKFDTHIECHTLYMIQASNNFLNSDWIRGSSVGCAFLNLCWNGLAPSFIGITCRMIRVSYALSSMYVHANTSRDCLNKRITNCLSYGVQQVPRLTYFRSLYVPKLICSCDNVELWVLALTCPQKWFWRSYNFSNDNTLFRMIFPLPALVASCNAFFPHPH